MRHGRRAACAAALALSAWLAGCATAPPAGSVPPTSGRLLVKVAAAGDQPAQSHTAAFELSGDEHAGEMKLLGPLGAQLAVARWSAAGASLQDSQGTREFPDLPSLAAEALGEPLPLGALLHWLQGRPWPGAPHQDRVQGFSQLGWSVDLARWSSEALIDATRVDPPGVSVRAKLDRQP